MRTQPTRRRRLSTHRSAVRERFECASRDALTSNPANRMSHGPTISTLLAVLAATSGAVVGSPMLVVVVPLVVVVLERVGRRHRLHVARRRADRAVIDVADLIGLQLRGGASLAASVEVALGDIALELVHHVEPVRRARRSGEGLPAALGRAEADGLVSLELPMASLRLLLMNGRPAAVSVDRVADTLRAGVGSRDEAAASAGQATASAALLAALPMVFATIVAAAEPSVAVFYATTWTGAACLACAVLLSSLSWWWIDWAVHR